MSAARRTDGRAQARKVHSSPYARPRTATTGWGLSRLFEPIRRRVFGYQEDDEESLALPVQVHASYVRTPARSDNIPGHFVKSPTPEGHTDTEERGLRHNETMLSIGAPEPPRSPTNSPKRRVPSPGLTPTDTLEKVVEFLTEAAGTPLKQAEADGVTGLIQQAIPGESMVSQALSQSAGRILSALEVEGSISVLRRRMEPRHEPFRFQSVISSRDASPAPPSSTPKTPRRTLKRNPNGPYRWDGVGSAKQNKRNCYASPAFGTPQISPEKSKSDGKRRRVDNSSSPPPTDSKLPYPITTPQASRSNAPTTPKLSVNTTTPRLRTPSITKPTTPSQPSPLRQTWQLSPTNSNEDLQQSSPPPGPRPSETASLVSQLIKEATPPRKPDLSNPYQTASPIAKVGPPRRSTRRTKAPTRAEQPNGKDVEEKKKQEVAQMDDVPAQAFIEATVPKGSKRSRPPTNFEKPSEPEPSQPAKAPFSLPASEQTESDRSPKKAKGVSFSAHETGSSSKDVSMANGTSNSGTADKAPSTSSLFGGSSTNNAAPSARPAFNSFKATTAPSRPSNLRFSYQPEGNSAPSSPTSNDKEKEKADAKDTEMSAPPPPTVVSSFGLSPLPTTGAPSSNNSKSNFSPFSVPSVPRVRIMSDPSRSRADVKMKTDSNMTESDADPKVAAAALKVASLPVFTFTMHVRADTSFLKAQNDAKSTPLGSLPKFNFTLVPAPSSSSSTASSSTATWTCSTCSLKNPDSAKDKCQICEAERPAPSAPAAPAPATKSFDWSAAGIAPPSSTAGSTWTCSTCGLSNPATATEKCDICDAERPGASAKAAHGAAAPAPAPAPAPVVKGFDWSAAGMAPPAPPTDKWTCGTCMCSNGKDEAKCTVCETPR